MKERLIQNFTNTKTEWLKEKDVFFSSLIIGLLSHSYMMFNKLPNIDDYVSMFHYGLGYQLGRWLLALIGNFMFRIDGVYSLPFLNGIFFLFMLSVSITIFLKPFPFKNRLTKRIFAALFISFPTVASTLGFMFTVPFYGIAILFAAIAFYFVPRYKYGFILSGFFICCSLGIYQAYWCLCASFLLLYLIVLCLDEKYSTKELLLISLKSFFSLLSGVILYLIINRLMLSVQGINLSDYQGVSQMGTIKLSAIPDIFLNAYGTFFKLISENYLYITWYPIVRFVIAASYGLTLLFLIIAIYILRKNPLKIIFLIGFSAIVPLTINSIYIMCNDASTIHLLMCYSVVLVFLLPLVFIQGVISNSSKSSVFKGIKAVYLMAVLLVIFFYVRLANIYYLNLEMAYNETNAFMTTLSARIQDTDGYTLDTPIYFHGLYSQSPNKNIWELRMVNQMHGTIDVHNVINSPLIRGNFFRVYLGNSFKELPDYSIMDQHTAYMNQMPNYPDDGSIEIIDDVLVVKFAEK